MPLDVSPEEFDRLVDRALDEIPEELAARVSNLVVLVEDVPPADQPDDLLGLYEGAGIAGGTFDAPGGLPDRVFIFRRPLLACCSTPEELVEEVRVTVVHEVAHHFGVDEDRLHELGWG